MTAPPPGVVFSAFSLSSPSHSPIVSRSWSQCALSCSRSRSTLASLRPRLSSGCECTMLCSAAAARALAALLPRVLPSNPGSLSLPCSSCMSSGRQPAGRNGHGYTGEVERNEELNVISKKLRGMKREEAHWKK